jgi:ribose 5-phosphate isomerase B
MRIALAADHAGFELKERIRQHLTDRGMGVDDLGTHSNESVDYPDYARAVGEEVTGKRADFGILVCGSGIGMEIAANKMPGIRAANARNEIDAQLSREHNNANVLALGGRVLEEKAALKIVDRWLNTAFAGGDRHQRRVEKITALERSNGSSKIGMKLSS